MSSDDDPQVTRVSEKGQTTIPKEYREELGLDSGQEVEWHRTDDGLVVQKHATSGRGVLLPDEDEETRKDVVDELSRRTRDDRDAAEWNQGE
jgi:AbrB family looped-hinge helix DNA binding protein